MVTVGETERPTYSYAFQHTKGLFQELWESTDLLFNSRLTWMLMLGPLALFGDATKLFGEALCFACAGIALIPCAERYVVWNVELATVHYRRIDH
jgi:hypothetical protein